ncbi:hypothetical protein C0Q70_10439 [Pomacea canaliculata]|uniref:G-protein coupled receptors family 2 profile 2 domain-containing protein n=1 Tax=Pomacea canaliculata TaxID=400727 RepID=A0A2T7PCN0_POMCA|nr:hypothetical protein C0Q70_10439 [Pomacea canaliculata]
MDMFARKLAKFILVLIPLFGIMYIIIFIAFPDGHTDNEFNVVYLYIEMGYNSFQGFILALLFCFLNEDVHSELRRLWRRHRTRRQESTYLKRSIAGSTWHPKSGDHSSSDHQDNTRNGASTRRHFTSVNSGSMPAALNCASTHSAPFGGHRPFVCNRQSLTSLPGNRHSFVSLPVNKQGMSSLTGHPGEKGMSGCRSDLTEAGAGNTGRDPLDQTSRADVCQYGKVLFLGRSCGSVKRDGRVVKGERVSENGNGGGGGVPAKIVFLDSDSSEETIPLSTSFELLTGRQTGDKASVGGQS